MGVDREAVHGTGGETEPAARALRLHDGMQQARRTDDGIHGAGGEAAGAAYAAFGVYGDQDSWGWPSLALPGARLAAEKRSQR